MEYEKTSLLEIGQLNLAHNLIDIGSKGQSTWQALLTSPREFAGIKRQGRNIIYPKLLVDSRLNGSLSGKIGKGLYIWFVRNDADEPRFVHVGMSAKGESTVARRTREHLKRQLDGSDRIHRVQWVDSDRYGALGPDLRKSPLVLDAAQEFLRRLQILYLFPTSNSGWEKIRAFEGMVSHAAAHLLDTQDRVSKEGWETTNTLSKNSRWDPDASREERCAEVSRMFLALDLPLLPERPRASIS